MDLINNRTKEIAGLALDGLYERSKAISANTANSLTPNYQRKEVSFEGSLREIIKRENEKEQLKIQNSNTYTQNAQELLKGQSCAQIAFMNSQVNEGYNIDIQNDMTDPYDENGNNVNIETEMMDEAKTGMRYQVIANLLSKSYNGLSSIIQGQTQG